jgi:EmrB/QacA subfamily drug resistance transporter
LTETPTLRLASPKGRLVVAVTVLGSGIAFLDGTVVNVAVPAIGRELHTDFGTLQWVVDAFLLTLGSLVLLGGSLGDTLGRSRVFLAGTVGFGIASTICGLAPDGLTLVLARGVQGVTAALLVPSSLAILSATFEGKDRGQAIGLWGGLTGVPIAIGPFAGGLLVDHGGWRFVFFINVPVVVVTALLGWRFLPRIPGSGRLRDVDLAGAALCTAGLGLAVWALIEGPRPGASAAATTLALAGAAVCLIAFVVLELRRRRPMLPLGLFRHRDFAIANLMTLAVYGALGGALFLVVLELQDVMGYTALAAGASMAPAVLMLLLLSPLMGRLVVSTGPRVLLGVGPLVAGAGLLLFTMVQPGASFLRGVLPGAVVFGLGMSIVVAPLTTTVMSSVPQANAGVASGVNNAVARLAGLIAVAALPLAAGLGGVDPTGQAFTDGFHRAMVISAVLCGIGGVVSLVGLRPGTAEAPLPARA